MGGRGKKTAPSSSRRSSDRIKAKSQPPTTMEKVEEEVDESFSASANGEQSPNSSQELEQAFLNIVKNNRSGESSFSSPLTVNHHSEFCIDPICSNPVCIQRIQNRDPEQFRHLKFRIDGVEFSPYDNIDHHHSEIREIQARMNLLCPQTPAMTVSNLSNTNPDLAADGTTLQCTSTTPVSQGSQDSQARDDHRFEDQRISVGNETSSSGNHPDPHAHGDVSTIPVGPSIAKESNSAGGTHFSNEHIGQHNSARAISIGGEHADPQDTHGKPISDAHGIVSTDLTSHGKDHFTADKHLSSGNLSSHENVFPVSHDLTHDSNSSGKNVDLQAHGDDSAHQNSANGITNTHAGPPSHGHQVENLKDILSLSHKTTHENYYIENHMGNSSGMQAGSQNSSEDKKYSGQLARPAHMDQSSGEDNSNLDGTIIQAGQFRIENTSGVRGPQSHLEHVDSHGIKNSVGQMNDTVGQHIDKLKSSFDPHGDYPRELSTSFAGQNDSTMVHEIDSPVVPTLAQDSNLVVGKQKEHKHPISSGKHAAPFSHAANLDSLNGNYAEFVSHPPSELSQPVNYQADPLQKSASPPQSKLESQNPAPINTHSDVDTSSTKQITNGVYLENFPSLSSGKNATTSIGANTNSSPPPSSSPTTATNWKGIFMGELNDNLKLQFFDFETRDGKNIASPPASVFHAGDSHWQRCLIGQFIDKPPPFFLIQKMVDTKWKKFGHVDIRSTESGMFVFQFETQASCDSVLEELWHVYHRPLLLRRWAPESRLVNLNCDRIPMWIKFMDLPLGLWHQEGLSYVASTIGFPLQMDSLTASRRHLGYARVCVEMNIAKELPNSTLVKLPDGSNAEIQIEYTWKPRKCTHCNVFGHNLSNCTNLPKETVPVQTAAQNTNEEEWKGGKHKKKNNSKPTSTNAASNNRYNVLSDNPEVAEHSNKPSDTNQSQPFVSNKNANDTTSGKQVEQPRNSKYPQKAFRSTQAIFTQRGRKSSDNIQGRAKNKMDSKVQDRVRKEILQSFSAPAHQSNSQEAQDYFEGDDDPPDWGVN